MAGYEKNSKVLESYETLAKLLNTDKKENIDRVYDALKSVAESEYKSGLEESAQSYRESRDTLAQKKAKADKYMSYFLSEGGYDRTGIAADAKIKSDLTYMSQTSALEREEQQSRNDLLRKKNESLNDIEAKRASEHSKADSELAELEYKVASDKVERELRLKELEDQNYWKKKEYELNSLKVNASISGGSGGSGGSNSAVSSDDLVKAYRTNLYNDILDRLSECTDSAQMQDIYDSLTGTNTENAVSTFGSDIYNKMIKDMKTKILAQRKSEKYENGIDELVDRLKSTKDLPTEMGRIQLDINFNKNSKYTMKQFYEAIERYNNWVKGEYEAVE